MAVVWILLASFLCLQKPAFSGYEAITPLGSTVSYDQSNNCKLVGNLCMWKRLTYSTLIVFIILGEIQTDREADCASVLILSK